MGVKPKSGRLQAIGCTRWLLEDCFTTIQARRVTSSTCPAATGQAQRRIPENKSACGNGPSSTTMHSRKQNRLRQRARLNSDAFAKTKAPQNKTEQNKVEQNGEAAKRPKIYFQRHTRQAQRRLDQLTGEAAKQPSVCFQRRTRQAQRGLDKLSGKPETAITRRASFRFGSSDRQTRAADEIRFLERSRAS